MIKSFKYALFLMTIALPAVAETPDLEDIIEEVNPSVVNIAADIDAATQALGAGIIVSADGYVVTNAHVTEGAHKITVITPDDISYEAELIGADAKTDIALLKVRHPLGLEPARFDDSDEIRVGSKVFAIGNPFGLGNSVSLGIISAKERDIEKGPYDSFLQTDAAINQGSSGGPLFNMNGGIVGVNTAIFSTDGKNMGVGFATPSNIVQWVVEQLKKNGRVVRGWLGISVQKIRSKGDDRHLLAVASMAENSPAAEAGLKVGDVIEAMGEAALTNPRVFSLEVSKIPPQTVLPLTVKRDGQTLDLQVRVAEMPENLENAQNQNTSENEQYETEKLKSFSELGLDKYSIRNAVNFEALGLDAYYNENEREFVVVKVEQGSDAAIKGVKAGDRFNRINGAKIFGIEDLNVKIKEAAASGEPLSLTARSGDEIYTVTIKTSSSDE